MCFQGSMEELKAEMSNLKQRLADVQDFVSVQAEAGCARKDVVRAHGA